MPDLPQFVRFWMVARKPSGFGSKTEPRQRYSTIEDARKTAQDLANANDGPFVVLEAVEILRPGDKTEETLL